MTKFAKKATAETTEAKVTKLPAGVAKGAKTTAKAEKPAKAAKAAKPAKEKKERAERAPREDNRKVKVTSDNPHREGTGRHAAFEALKKCKTVGDYYATGNKPKYITKWDDQGFITIG